MTHPSSKCRACRDGAGFGLPISMAFQPIVSAARKTVFAYEALVRGADGAGADTVFSQVTDETLYTFDQTCRRTAIGEAARLGLAEEGALLSINFLPNAVYNPKACIRVTLDAARAAGFPHDRIMFEFVESEKVDPDHLIGILAHYKELGFLTAIDDFGAGHAGLGLLADFVPDVVKLDTNLVRNIDRSPVRRTILRNTVAMLQDLGVIPVAEGIEALEEYEILCELGVDLMQGYLFAKPGFETLPMPCWPKMRDIKAA